MRYREVKEEMKVKVYRKLTPIIHFVGKEGVVVKIKPNVLFDPEQEWPTKWRLGTLGKKSHNVGVILDGDDFPHWFSHKELREVK